MKARPAAVAFDLYDTLVFHDWRSHAASIADELEVPVERVFDAYDVQRHYRDRGGGADAATVLAAVGDHCGLERTRRQWEELAERESAMLKGAVQVYDDSMDVLRRLRTDGVRTAIVSNCGPSTRPVVDHLGLEAVTDLVVLSCEVKVSKPSPKIFEISLAHLGATAENSWFVDDRRDYLDGARAVGMRTVRIARDVGFGEDVEGGDHPVIGSLTELHRLF